MKFCDSRSATRKHQSGALALTALILMLPFIADPMGFLHTLVTELFPPAPVEVVDKIKKQLRQKRENHEEHFLDKTWRDLAADHAGLMVESVSSTSSYSARPGLEVAAGGTISFAKPLETWEGPWALCERALFGDEDTEVRALAVILLAGCYAHSDDKRIGEIVANVVYDQNNTVILRTEAYRCSIQFAGCRLQRFSPHVRLAFGSLRTLTGPL